MSDEMKKDGAMRIFEALSTVDEELLERSEGKKKIIPFWRYSKVMAACICLVVLGTATFAATRIAEENSTSADCAAPMALEEIAADDDAVADEGAAMNVADAEAEFAIDDVETDAEAAQEAPTEGTKNEMMQDEMDDLQAAMQESSKEETYDYVVDNSDGMIMDWETVVNAPEQVDEQTLRKTEVFGKYIPTKLPEGYVFADGSRVSRDGEISGISITWTKGLDYASVSVGEYIEEQDAVRLVDISKPETYDVHLYEIPYASSVPDEVWDTFNTPIFRENDFSLEIVEARMKSVEEAGDTDTPRGNFAVLYDSGIVVSFTGRGTVKEIWDMFQSIEEE